MSRVDHSHGIRTTDRNNKNHLASSAQLANCIPISRCRIRSTSDCVQRSLALSIDGAETIISSNPSACALANANLACYLPNWWL